MTKHKTNYYLLGILTGIISTIFYSLMDASIKYANYISFLSFDIIYLHAVSLITIFIIIISVSMKGIKVFHTNKLLLPIFLRSNTAFFNFYGAFYVLQNLPLDIYYCINFTMPIFATILGIIFLKESLSKYVIISIIIGILGIIIITNPFDYTLHKQYILSILVTICIAFSIAVSGLITRKYLSNLSIYTNLCYIFIFITMNTLIINIYHHYHEYQSIWQIWFTFDQNIILYTILIAIFCILGMSFFLLAYSMAPLQLVAPTEYLLLVWGIILGYIIFDDMIELRTLSGATLIIISTLILIKNNK